ncbi:MAG TPA: CHAP domain-containing protein [Planctomycetota bacterium]|jgi:surface antigen
MARTKKSIGEMSRELARFSRTSQPSAQSVSIRDCSSNNYVARNVGFIASVAILAFSRAVVADWGGMAMLFVNLARVAMALCFIAVSMATGGEVGLPPPSVATSSPQMREISGFVYYDGKPVKGAVLRSKDGKRLTVTNTQGFYRLRFDDGTRQELTLSRTGLFFKPPCLDMWFSGEDLRRDVMAFKASAAARAITATSPNGFVAPQCTWWSDSRENELGWRLMFSQNFGRDAWTWPSLLTNAKVVSSPQAHGLVIFAPWGGNSKGHVGVVESVSGFSFTMSHSNFANGSIFRTVGTTPIYLANMKFGAPLAPGYVMFSPGSTIYRVTFLAKK